MEHTSTETLKFYERIHAVIESFDKRATWTPAEGAMLVSGVRPPSVGYRVIPEQAMHLFDDASAATQPQLLDAILVLREWNEDRDWDREEENGTAFDADPTPQRFVEWCDDAFQQRPRDMGPAWLDHFVGRAPGDPPAAIPPEFASEVSTRLRSVELLQRERDSAIAATAVAREGEVSIDSYAPDAIGEDMVVSSQARTSDDAPASC